MEASTRPDRGHLDLGAAEVRSRSEVSSDAGNGDFEQACADRRAAITDRRVALTDRRASIGARYQVIANLQTQAALQAQQEREKARIAADLHDSIGSSLSAIKVGLEYAIKQTQGEAPQSNALSLEKLMAQLQATIHEVNRIAVGLRPAILDDLGIVATVNWFCRELQSCYQNVRVVRETSARETDVPDYLKTTIFRILQEATNNTLKHGGADLIRVTLSKEADEIRLSIEDNGKGFDVLEARRKQRFGIASMHQRAKWSGGTLMIKSAPGAGTHVFATWPSTATDQALRCVHGSVGAPSSPESRWEA